MNDFLIFELNAARQLYFRLQIEAVVTESAAGLGTFSNEGLVHCKD